MCILLICACPPLHGIRTGISFAAPTSTAGRIQWLDERRPVTANALNMQSRWHLEAARHRQLPSLPGLRECLPAGAAGSSCLQSGSMSPSPISCRGDDAPSSIEKARAAAMLQKLFFEEMAKGAGDASGAAAQALRRLNEMVSESSATNSNSGYSSAAHSEAAPSFDGSASMCHGNIRSFFCFSSG
jgi:hypothetical protein